MADAGVPGQIQYPDREVDAEHAAAFAAGKEELLYEDPDDPRNETWENPADRRTTEQRRADAEGQRTTRMSETPGEDVFVEPDEPVEDVDLGDDEPVEAEDVEPTTVEEGHRGVRLRAGRPGGRQHGRGR